MRAFEVADVADHFADLRTQQHAARLGMWVFLASELLLFAGLFAVYAAYRVRYDDTFVAAIARGSRLWGTVNTFVLLTSSLSAALAVRALRLGARGGTVLGLGATIALGLAFLAVKGVEYAQHIAEGMLPARMFSSATIAGPGAVAHATIYWFATGLHAVHVVAGLALLTWLLILVLRRRLTAANPVALENGAMYWHLVDVIWLFLWPLLYLAR